MQNARLRVNAHKKCDPFGNGDALMQLAPDVLSKGCKYHINVLMCVPRAEEIDSDHAQ